MKQLYFSAFFFFLLIGIKAQVGINTEQPTGMLDIKNPTGKEYGLVLPRVTTYEATQNLQDGLTTTVEDGTIVYDNTTKKYYVRVDGKWKEILFN